MVSKHRETSDQKHASLPAGSFNTLQIQDLGSVLVAVTFPCLKVGAGRRRHDSPSQELANETV